MSSLLPYGLTPFSTDTTTLVINIIFTLTVAYAVYVYHKKKYRIRTILFSLILIYNLILIFMSIYYVNLPVVYKAFSYGYLLWLLAFIEYIYTSKQSKKNS